MKGTFLLTKMSLSGEILYWSVPYAGGGHWSPYKMAAKKYSSENAVHSAWTWVSQRHGRVKVIEDLTVSCGSTEKSERGTRPAVARTRDIFAKGERYGK